MIDHLRASVKAPFLQGTSAIQTTLYAHLPQTALLICSYSVIDSIRREYKFGSQVRFIILGIDSCP